MTYCLAIKLREGLVCLADGRITSGRQVSSARKASLHGPEGAQICVMTSGLRSLRDKTIAYLERRRSETQPAGYASLLEAVDVFARCLRQVAEEDRAALEASQLSFNLHAILAGQLREDAAPSVFLVYPEGNWIEIDERTPYLSIGATAYGKPILDRTLKPETPLATALKIAYLSFDSTRVSSADVGFPLDMMTFAAADRTWRSAHYEDDDLREQRLWWGEHVTELAARMPDRPWRAALLPPGPAKGQRLSLVGDD